MPRSYNSPAMDDLRANVIAAKARIEGSVDNASDTPRGLGALADNAVEQLVSLQAKNKEAIRESLVAKVQTMAEQVYGNVEDSVEKQALVDEFIQQFKITTNDEGEDVIYYSTSEGRASALELSNGNISGTLSIPAELQIDVLEINHNMITSLPELPKGLTLLWCNSNQLAVLPELPSGLTKLNCGSNQLTVLPELPSGLTELYCGHNELTILPKLPEGLIDLWCNKNKLTELLNLPSGLTILYCYKNHLTTLPELPKGLTSLVWHDNPLNQSTLDMIKSRGL